MDSQIVSVKGSVSLDNKTDSTIDKILAGSILFNPTFKKTNHMEKNSKKLATKMLVPTETLKSTIFQNTK